MISNLKGFYLKKFLSLYIPFFLWSVYYYERSNNLLNSISEIFFNIPRAFYSSLTESQYYHMWYMYTLIGLILLEPFLKRLLDNLDFKELFWLCNVLIIAKALNLFGIIIIGELYFSSWVVYYIIGCFLIKEETKRLYPLIICSSFVAFFISVVIDLYFSESVFLKNIFEYSPIMIIQVGGIFSIFLWIEKSRKPALKKTVKYLSKFTFQIYLAHPAIMDCIVHKLWFLKNGLLSDHPLAFFVIVIIMTFMCSALVAAIIEGVALAGKNIYYIFRHE